MGKITWQRRLALCTLKVGEREIQDVKNQRICKGEESGISIPDEPEKVSLCARGHGVAENGKPECGNSH